jgi:hypothetical protein
MTSTKTTTKTEHFFRALVVLAMLASLLAVLAVRPAHADGEFIFKVNFTGDLPDLNPGDGVCDVTTSTENTCTLRAAIQETNATPELDVIHFAIPEAFRDPSSGVATISPAKELPTITEPVVIEGYSQPGASVNTATKGTNAAPKIVLSGAKVTQGSNSELDGLTISGGGTTIKGLVISGFKRDASFGGGMGIRLPDVAGNSDNVIAGNFIGTDASGTTAVANEGVGVATFFNSTNNTIGGTAPADRNLISGNGSSGISLTSTDNKVQNNLIGTDKSGTNDLGNGFSGVSVGASNNSIGDGTSGGSNTIAFNKARGVEVDIVTLPITPSLRNRVLSNSIFSNGLLGIDLGRDGVSVNDTGDSDSGPNNLQNFPVISSAKTSSTATTIRARLNSQVNTPYIVQFFSNPAGTNEGKTFIGQKTVITDASGNVSFTFKPNKKVAAGRTITATATRNAFNIPGDTSEFSAPRKVVAS